MLEKRILMSELQKLRNDVSDRLDLLETRLLREFRSWGVYFESRFRANEMLIGGFNERLISLEERVSDIERRRDA